jgi:signal transduction histidine kinase
VVLLTGAGLLAWRYARREHKAFMLVDERNRHILQQARELEALNAQLMVANDEVQRQLEIQSEQAQQLEISQTETRSTNNHLEQVNEALLSANAERTKQQAALETMNKELSYKNQALSEAERFRLNMLGIVSHDLKTPISVIIGLSGVLLDDSRYDFRTQDILRHINESGERMSALVRDLLDTAARSAGKVTVQLRPTELKDIVAGVLAHHIHSSERKGQTLIFSPHEEAWTEGDVQRLFQVFDNLIGNAIKYAPIGGKIWITISRQEQKARFTVKDEGVGFTEEDKARAFGFFQKLSAQPTGGEPSSGIGLAIVRQIVELHNGAVWIESEAGKGATVIVELPLLAEYNR